MNRISNDRRARYQMTAEIDHAEALRQDRIAQLEKIKSDYLERKN